MPKCNNWTLELEGIKDICLIINGKRLPDLLSDKDYESQGLDMFKSSFVKSIMDDGKDNVKVTVNETEFTLDCKKMISTVVLGWDICVKKDLLDFWNVMENVLKNNYSEIAPCSKDDNVVKVKTPLDPTNSANMNEDLNETEETDKEFQQTNLFDSIKSKSAGKYYLDILCLKTPPPDFRVRERHEDFVEKIALTMIEKRCISIDNAANVIAFIKVDKADFKEEMLQTCPIYVIDGNHNVKAQTIAFDRTKDWIFKFRMVHIYCNLTPEEGLVLGTSRNEDSSMVLKFSDFEKVSLVRRYLYSSTQTAIHEEPPEPKKGFTAIYKQLLNLKTKKEVDAKAVVRFLATKLSSRNYSMFSRICNNSSIKASRFECLRGLDEDQVYNELHFLNTSSRSKLEWRTFREKCLKYRKKNTSRKFTVQVQFNETCTKADILTNERRMLTDCASFTFTSADGIIVKSFSAREVEHLVFGSNPILKRVQEKKSVTEIKCSGERKERKTVHTLPIPGQKGKSSHTYSRVLSDSYNEDLEQSEDEREIKCSGERKEGKTVHTLPIPGQKGKSSHTYSRVLSDSYNEDLEQSEDERVLSDSYNEDLEQSEDEREPNMTKLSPSKVMPNVFKRQLITLEGTKESSMCKQKCSSPFLMTSTPVKFPDEIECSGERKEINTVPVHKLPIPGHKENSPYTDSRDERSIYSFTSEDSSPVKSYKSLKRNTPEIPIATCRPDDHTKPTEMKMKFRKCNVRITDITTVKDLDNYISSECKKAKHL